MGASSVTGTGQGSAEAITTKGLFTSLNTPPVIMLVGYVESVGGIPVSPPTIGNTVEFETPMPAGPEGYIVLLTPIGATTAYIGELFTNDDENFSGFSFFTDDECTVMYAVIQVGIRQI